MIFHTKTPFVMEKLRNLLFPRQVFARAYNTVISKQNVLVSKSTSAISNTKTNPKQVLKMAVLKYTAEERSDNLSFI